MTLTFLAFGFLLIALGASALTLGLAFRARGSVRMLLAFGGFALLYGVGVAIRSSAMEQFGLSPGAARFILWQANYWSSVPALIYTEEARGQGWYRSVRVLWIVWIPLAIVLTIADVVTKRPGAWSVFYLPFVIVMQATILAHLVWGRSTFAESRRLQRIGGIAFVFAILHDNLAVLWPVWWLRLEPIGAVAFIGSLAVATGRQFFARERELAVVESEMKTARGIQQSILPRTDLTLAGLRMAARYMPMRGIAGDLYDFHVVNDHQIGVLVADVTGHGVPAALIASMVKVAFSAERERAASPADLLTGMNRTLCGHLAGQFVTAVYVFFDSERRCLRYSVAGHPPPIVRRAATGEPLKLSEEAGYLLGFDPQALYKDAGLDLHTGDRVLLYTDGLIEAEDRNGHAFGDVRLREVLARGAGESADAFAAILLKDVRAWSGQRGAVKTFEDDLTFVVVDVV